jgi:hypothetical protein
VLTGGIVKFNFPNINLPDSLSDEAGSKGFVRFKVKLKDNLPLGTTIENTAYIYFDFNAPIITNTTVNTIALPLATPTVSANAMEGCTGDTILLQSAANAAYTYTWLLNGNSIANSNTYVWGAVQSGSYKVRVTDGIFTEVSDEILITINDLPTVTLTFPVNPFCRSAQPTDLTTYGNPAGGIYTGTGVLGTSLDVSSTGTAAITYTYTDSNGCTDQKQASALVEECIGIGEVDAITFNIYPNPSNGTFNLNVNTNAGNINYKIMDVFGKSIDSQNLQSYGGLQSFIINSEGFATGMYYFQIQTTEGIYTKRLILE